MLPAPPDTELREKEKEREDPSEDELLALTSRPSHSPSSRRERRIFPGLPTRLRTEDLVPSVPQASENSMELRSLKERRPPRAQLPSSRNMPSKEPSRVPKTPMLLKDAKPPRFNVSSLSLD